MIWLTVTLLAFAAGVLGQLRLRSPLANPTLIATLIVAAGLLATSVPYDTYLRDVQPLTTLLAPAVVALAVPLYRLRAL
ncbi:LrgB family protein, partial [Deinococcus sp. 23YEL01]